jgi:hypothetical protein
MPKRLPKIGTVCKEGYKISRNGSCIKDKKYVKPKVKRSPKVGTVCLEGYKITKDGRCVKDKKYKIVLDNVVLDPVVEKKVEEVKTTQEVQKLVENVVDNSKNLSIRVSPSVVEILPTPPVTPITTPPAYSEKDTVELQRELVEAESPQEVKELLENAGVVETPKEEVKQLVEAKSLIEVNEIASKETNSIPALEEKIVERIEKDNTKILKYVQKVFKELNIEYKDCSAVDVYREKLRIQCIKFLGYDSPEHRENCIKDRFKSMTKKYPTILENLRSVGCSV